jgi:hypothetical protein
MSRALALAPLLLAACACERRAARRAARAGAGALRRPHARRLEGDARFWRVEDGAIVGESTPANPCAQTTYLTWKGAAAGDFELELEWRLRGGNSGVQFRSRADGRRR